RSYAALFIFRTSLPCAYAHGYKDTGATRLLAKHRVLQMIHLIGLPYKINRERENLSFSRSQFIYI
ncbi:MAG: hypothetical protein LBH32_06695, partial [Dysgonamonadaceae bacterium]|nr:hypothetical protein [Dysgonamonadaceae bacterium]